MAEYKEQIRNYPQKEKQYKADYSAYLTAKANYNNQIKQIRSKKSVQKYRMQQIEEWKQTVLPSIYLSDDTDQIKEGLSEQFFAKKISLAIKKNNCADDDLHYLSNKPLLRLKVPAGESFYYPDLVIVNKGLYVDVEIDEPYVAGDGKPIHHLIEDLFLTTSVDQD